MSHSRVMLKALLAGDADGAWHSMADCPQLMNLTAAMGGGGCHSLEDQLSTMGHLSLAGNFLGFRGLACRALCFQQTPPLII
jgi:hypothetical protein